MKRASFFFAAFLLAGCVPPGMQSTPYSAPTPIPNENDSFFDSAPNDTPTPSPDPDATPTDAPSPGGFSFP